MGVEIPTYLESCTLVVLNWEKKLGVGVGSHWAHTPYYNALKIFKTKPLCDFLYRAKRALWILEKLQVSEICSRKLCFLSESQAFSKLFADDLSQGETDLFACLEQDHKVMTEKDICPKFCKCADLKHQHSTVLSVIYHDKWTLSWWNRNQQIFWWEFSFFETFWSELATDNGQSLGWPSQQVT